MVLGYTRQSFLDAARKAKTPLDITRLLAAAERGDEAAASALYGAVYGVLHDLARKHRGRWRGDDTLNATALVNEAFLKLSGSEIRHWQNRSHYFAVASRAMRQILVDKARARSTSRRGSGIEHVPINESIDGAGDWDEDLAAEILSLHALLEDLERRHPRQARVIECRFFGGLSLDETSHALGLSSSTVRRDWELAKIWLNQALG